MDTMDAVTVTKTADAYRASAAANRHAPSLATAGMMQSCVDLLVANGHAQLARLLEEQNEVALELRVCPVGTRERNPIAEHHANLYDDIADYLYDLVEGE